MHDHACLLSKARRKYTADMVTQAMQCLCSACIGGMPVCYCSDGMQCDLPERISFVSMLAVAQLQPS